MVWGLFGVRPLAPGWSRIEVRPQPGDLRWATIRVPSLRGPVEASFNQSAAAFRLALRVQDGVRATVCLPRLGLPGKAVRVGARVVEGRLDGDFVCVDTAGEGSKSVVVLRGAQGD